MQISGNCIKFPTERIKTFVAILMFKTENQWKTPDVVGSTDGTWHTAKQGDNLERTPLNQNIKEDSTTEHPKEETITRTLKSTLKRTLYRTLLDIGTTM